VDFHGDTTFSATQSKVSIPRDLMVTKCATDLFSFIARQIETFLRTFHGDCFTPSEHQPVFSLGLTFSYPVDQTAIGSGILLRWTKGFDIPNVVGRDVCQLLQHEIDSLHLPVRVTALVNDAAGTIMSGAYTLPVSQTRTSIGAIFGTGTNAVYLEKLSRITKPLDRQYDRSTGEMLVSIEWGSFDNDLSVLPNTPYDVQLNQVSVNPGNQMFEKRVSGMFLGELLRDVTLAMHTDPAIKLFHDTSSNPAPVDDGSPLHVPWAVDSSILSVAEADGSDELAILRQKIADYLAVPAATVGVEDAQAVKLIAHAIGKRAARLAGMAIGAVVLQSERLVDLVDPPIAGTETLPSRRSLSQESSSGAVPLGGDLPNALDEHGIVDIAVDGSLIEFYPGFETYMREVLRAVEGIGAAGEKRIRMGIAKDGSSVGAAIIALLAARQA